MNNIVDALIGSGDFRSWVNIIKAANPLSLPLSATVFMLENIAVSRLPFADPFLLPYQVVPQCLTFADLRLPTFLPDKFIIVTRTPSPISPSMTPLSPSLTLLYSSTSGSTSIASLIPSMKPASPIPTPTPASSISSTMP
uniref:uncharacterized protein LOC105349436 n=1 Tax=Fragaria vesca subsp. vesca TaxID=101020 RepID=UPI0005CA6026|nr:PREDICTED: uncharacterized protein LOC105349436 [Fragaria vesca subsp. vesca]